ncbi:MAG: hypothetical protein ACKVT0_14945 [Planctomycetaceae bacterium]
MAIFLFPGCSSDGPQLASVSGEVTFHGLPLAAEVLFEPLDDKQQRQGRPSAATTDAEGKFDLTFTENDGGAIVGWHRVTVKVVAPATTQIAGNPLHSRVQLKTVQLLRRVQDSDNHFVFALSI